MSLQDDIFDLDALIEVNPNYKKAWENVHSVFVYMENENEILSKITRDIKRGIDAFILLAKESK